MIIIDDVTEKVKAEEQLRSLKEYNEDIIRNIPASIVVFDKALKAVSANRVFHDNFLPSEGIEGKTVHDVLPSALLGRQEAARKILRVFRTGRMVKDTKIESATARGRTSVLNIKYVPVAVQKGTPEYVMAVLDDVTDIIRLREKVAKLAKKLPFTEREKRAFYGLVQYPLLTDLQLARKLDMSRTTLTSIKGKLLKQNLFTPRFIPNFASLGCELLCVLHGTSLQTSPEGKRMPSGLIDSPEAVLAIGTDREFFSFIVAEHFTDAKKLLDAVASEYGKSDQEIPQVRYYPLSTSKISPCFSFGPALKRLFGLEIQEEKSEQVKPRIREFTRNEKVILYALTEFPELTDSGIALKTGLSRVTVGNIRKALLRDNILQRVNMPSLEKIGFEMMVLSQGNGVRQAGDKASAIFRISTGRESSCFSAYTDYAQYKTVQGSVGEQPFNDVALPIAGMTFQKLKIAPLVKKVLEVDVDF